jgi:type IV fimbrial biogenesis protein FimT
MSRAKAFRCPVKRYAGRFQFPSELPTRFAQRGATLCECLIAVGILGVISGGAVRSGWELQARQSARTEIEAFTQDVHLARSEAVRRREKITVCAWDESLTSRQAPRCVGSGNNWASGWLVFVDRARSGVIDDGDEVLVVHQGQASGLRFTGTLRSFSLLPLGISAGAAAHFEVQAPHGDPWLICVSKPGRVRYLQGTHCG